MMWRMHILLKLPVGCKQLAPGVGKSARHEPETLQGTNRSHVVV